CMQHNALPLTF
nr:immunoglobulin light chain junction region [Macaca mulatta]